MLRDLRLFLKEFWGSFATTGAVLPSSPALAHAVLKPLRNRPLKNIRVLEVGPGTGAFTFEIIKHLREGDELHIYELNERFYHYLNHRLEKKQKPGVVVKLFHKDILSLDEEKKYDYIISSLPFSNFDAKTIGKIMEMYLKHLLPHGMLSYFEYLLPHRWRIRFLKPSERARVRRMIVQLKKYVEKHQTSFSDTWLNVPPARARHLQKIL
jgi:phosphatidylethanolamine/phosphatidyl-N-methylethanolamine N-methyltransferase